MMDVLILSYHHQKSFKLFTVINFILKNVSTKFNFLTCNAFFVFTKKKDLLKEEKKVIQEKASSKYVWRFVDKDFSFPFRLFAWMSFELSKFFHLSLFAIGKKNFLRLDYKKKTNKAKSNLMWCNRSPIAE